MSANKYQRTGVGPRRKNGPYGRIESTPFGTVAPLVREEIDRRGYVMAGVFAKSLGLSWPAVAAACKREALAGRAAHLFDAYFRPDVAAEVQAALAKATRP